MIRVRFRRTDIVCRHAVELLTDYLEDALPRSQRIRFERHLRGCPHCSEYLAQIEATIIALGHVTPAELISGARDDLSALYRRWLTDRP